jgi:hypothetical protein
MVTFHTMVPELEIAGKMGFNDGQLTRMVKLNHD